jgi:8-oxo-dGTP diphosphatase
MAPVVVVVAAVIERRGRFLVARRLRGTHLEGCWEFPGGKCDPGESLEDALRRELREELDVGAAVGSEILAVSHDYGDRTIELHFFACALDGEPRARLGQELQWVGRDRLDALSFPPADEALIRLLRSGPPSEPTRG